MLGRVALVVVLLAGTARAEGADPGPSVDEPAVVVAPRRTGVLRGRVYENGSIAPLPGIRVMTEGGTEATTDVGGRFTITLPEGEQKLVLLDDDHEILHATEIVRAGEGISVEYRMTAKDEHKRYRSRVRGEGRHEGERFSLRDEELHMAPGTLGDPFRTIALMPGVATPVPLLPLWVVRGSSPGTNGFFLDGMRVPQLFHFLIGGGVVNATLVDRIDFYPSGYDASFGRFAGGIVDGETRPARDGYHAELELKLYDVGALVEAKLPKDVRITVSGHYAWPAFLVHAFDDQVDLSYWDFQLRLDWKGLTVEALGSFDALSFARTQQENGLPVKVSDAFRLAFYRVQLRDREKWGRVELETGIVGGLDDVASFGGIGVRKLSLNLRANVSARWKRFRLVAGAEAELQRFRAQNFSPDVQAAEPDQLGDFGGDRGGVVGGVFVEGIVDLWPNHLQLTLGARVDAYSADNVTLVGFDPRGQVRWKILPELTMTAATGIYQQAPSFPIGVPGIDTFALQLGLQRAWQSAVGFEAKLPAGFDFKITGYYQRFSNLNDVVLDVGAALCTAAPPESLSGVSAQVIRQLKGDASGMELLLRRKIGRVTGWVSYTLSQSERVYSCGLRPSDFDQRHLLNVVVQVRLPWRLVAGAHLYVASGRPYTQVDPVGLAPVRNNARLPTFVQLDLRVDREWLFKKWALSAFIEIINVTDSEINLGLFTPTSGSTGSDTSIFNTSSLLGQLNSFRLVLPTIGIKARL